MIGTVLQKLPISKLHSQIQSLSWVFKKTTHWWKKNKTGTLAKGISEGCCTENHSENTNVCQAIPAGELSMHTPISKQVLTRNSCISCEDEALSHIDMKPDNSKLVSNIFGFIPKSPLQLYTGEVLHYRYPRYLRGS